MVAFYTAKVRNNRELASAKAGNPKISYFRLMTKLRNLLLPLSMLYAAVLSIRNGLYDRKFLASKKFSLPVIAVGNLSLGGTGKSPMIEFLMDRLHSRYRLAVQGTGVGAATGGDLA